MENLSKRNARLVLIHAANIRADRLSRPEEMRGKYWKDVVWHYLQDARCVNKGEPVSGERLYRER